MSYARKLDDVALLLDELEGLESSASSGKPLEIPLSSIEEDPDQPRRAFDAETLEELAASIRERGVLQPIGLTPVGLNGMHRTVFGARRFRAAQLAGRATIAAFIHSGEASDPYDQMIENIQWDDVWAADIAAFIASRLAAGEKQKDIALRLGKDKSYIAMYAAVAQMAPVLRERLTTSPIRAVYELHQMWRKFPRAVEAFCAQHDSFTRVQVVAFCEGLSGRPPRTDDSPLSDELHDAANPHDDGALPGADRKLNCAPQGRKRRTRSARSIRMRSRRSAAPFDTTRATGVRSGAGDVTCRAWAALRAAVVGVRIEQERGARSGLLFEDDGTVEDAPLAALRLVSLKIGLANS